MSSACLKWLFTTWGRVTTVDSDRFDLDSGSGTTVRVIAPGYSGISTGDYASARGILNPLASPPTLTASPANINKQN